MKATQAAKNTSTLIEDIVKKVHTGEQLANGTSEAFRAVATSSTKVVSLMEEVAAASREQAQGIEQINSAIAGMSKTTQQNAASSEELASIMAIFKTDIGNKERSNTAAGSKKLISHMKN
jgi:methyl-accepting chemotaxis protein